MSEPRQAASRPGPEDTQEFEVVTPSPAPDAEPQNSGKIVGQVEIDELDRLLGPAEDDTAPSPDDTQEIFLDQPEGGD